MNIKLNKTLLTIIIIAIILIAFKSITDTENKANEYMNYLNSNKIRGGCFYIKGDSIRTFKNY